MSATVSPTQASAPPAAPYVLKDELAQFCLPRSEKDPTRKIAWTNSLCVCVLLVGVIGVERIAEWVPKSRVEEPPIVQIDESKPPPQEFIKRDASEEEELQEAMPDQPVLPTLVAIDTGNIPFSVPVEGVVSIAASTVLAAPPPRVITRQTQAPPVAKAPSEPANFGGLGKKTANGYVPNPDISDLPKELQKNLPRGVVTLRLQFTVTTTGELKDLSIEKSSPYSVFDQFILDWYKRKGTFVAKDQDASYYDNVRVRFPD